jgi:hypothetical protein
VLIPPLLLLLLLVRLSTFTCQVGLVHHHITFLATGPRLLRGLAA